MLQDPTLAPRLVDYLYGKAPLEERIQAAMTARFLTAGWTAELRSQLLDFYGLAKMYEGGNSYRGYLNNAANDVLKSIPPEEVLARIAEGAKKPVAALGIVQSLSGKLTSEQSAALRKLDGALVGDRSEQARELAKAAIVALGRGDEPAIAYLHEVFEAQPDRRQDVAQRWPPMLPANSGARSIGSSWSARWPWSTARPPATSSRCSAASRKKTTSPKTCGK